MPDSHEHAIAPQNNVTVSFVALVTGRPIPTASGEEVAAVQAVYPSMSHREATAQANAVKAKAELSAKKARASAKRKAEGAVDRKEKVVRSYRTTRKVAWEALQAMVKGLPGLQRFGKRHEGPLHLEDIQERDPHAAAAIQDAAFAFFCPDGDFQHLVEMAAKVPQARRQDLIEALALRFAS